MNRTTQDGSDYYWTRAADETMGLDYNGYGFYGQTEPSPVAAYAEPTPATPPRTDWTQPGVGYAPTYSPGTMVPMPTPYFYAAPAAHPNATAAIVLGIIGLVAFPPLSYVALAMSMRGRREAQQNPGAYSQDSLTAGLVLGAIGSVLCTIYVLLFGIMILALALGF